MPGIQFAAFSAMRRLYLPASIALAVFVSTFAPDRSGTVLATPQTASAPTVDEILSNYVNALGGEEAYHKLRTRVMKAVIRTTGSGELGSVEIYETAPDKGTSTLFYPGDSPYRRGYNGSKGWVVDPDAGPQDADEDTLKDLKERFDFFAELHYRQRYPGLKAAGTETIEGRPAYVTEYKRPDGETERLYFDQQTWLLVRRDVPSPSGVPRQYVMSDYQSVDGIQYPFKVRLTDPEFEATFEYTEIRHNTPIDDSQYEKPAH